MPTDAVAYFDLDGCLVDSRLAITASINDALQSLGAPRRSAEGLYRFIGPPLYDAFAELLGPAADQPDVIRAIAAYRTAYAQRSVTDTRAVAGIDSALRELAVRRVVVTTKPTHFAGPILEATHLAPLISAVFAPSLEALHETKVETLGRAIEATGAGCAGACAVMVGDRHHDVDAGKAHGVRTVAVTWGLGDRDELEAAHPDVIVDDPNQLAAAIRELVGRQDDR